MFVLQYNAAHTVYIYIRITNNNVFRHTYWYVSPHATKMLAEAKDGRIFIVGGGSWGRRLGLGPGDMISYLWTNATAYM